MGRQASLRKRAPDLGQIQSPGSPARLRSCAPPLPPSHWAHVPALPPLYHFLWILILEHSGCKPFVEYLGQGHFWVSGEVGLATAWRDLGGAKAPWKQADLGSGICFASGWVAWHRALYFHNSFLPYSFFIGLWRGLKQGTPAKLAQRSKVSFSLCPSLQFFIFLVILYLIINNSNLLSIIC